MQNQNGTAPQAPTIDQLVAEAHARLRRVNGDLVFVGNLIDTLVQEIMAREKKISELREPIAETAEAE